MKIQILFIILHNLLNCSLVISAPSKNSNSQVSFNVIHKEPAFGIEFTLDHIISSVTLSNGSTYGIVKTAGGAEYQSLMRYYLGVAHEVHSTQISPARDPNMAVAMSQEAARRDSYIRHGESWWDYLAVKVFNQPVFLPAIFEGDEYAGDAEVAILASAVEVSKNATLQQLEHRFNITADELFSWPYAGIVVPDFLWTTIKPKPDPEIQPDGRVSWNANFDHDSTWFLDLLRKFSTAVYRNKFRRWEWTGWQEILSSNRVLLGISPTSVNRGLYAREQHYSDFLERSIDATYGLETLSPTYIVVGLHNATLSVWLEEQEGAWTPWNTYTELGGHILDTHSGDEEAETTFWDQCLEKIDALAGIIDSPPSTMLDLILSGESWTPESVTRFQERLRASKRMFSVKNVIYESSEFAASKESASVGHEAVNDRGGCCV